MMKRIINILISTAAVILVCSCTEQIIVDEVIADRSERIVLSFSSGATKAGSEVEAYLDHVDVLIFDYQTEPGDLVYHERVALNGSSSSVLQVARSTFAPSAEYYVQIVANSSADASVFGSLTDYASLINMKQEDMELHLTGLDIESAPEYFLMDGVAYLKGSRPEAPDAVVLNNGVASDDTDLEVILERAAAKVEITITAGNTSTFELNFTEGLAGSEGALYYIRNMPYETFITDHNPVTTTKLVTTYRTNNSYFEWNPASSPKKVVLTTYVYAHDWKDQSVLEKESCVIMNLPFVYIDKEKNESHEHPNSWYKIPMSADQKFDRNMHYKVHITLNRAGATTMLDPVTVGVIDYSVEDWTEVIIPVGGDENRPKYLTVNRKTMDMNNVDTDNQTLEFSSSSEITNVRIDKVWFIDKFGAEQDITSQRHGIVITPDAGLNGNIKVYSPKPDNNTIRYITFTITNADGDSRTVTVTQYPLEYITNTLSWYSYRSDFIGSRQSVPTTFENLSSSNNVTSISYTGNDTYRYNTGSTSGFFRSKVVRDTYSSTHSNESHRGRSDIDGYYWDSRKSYSDVQDPGNARMYHVRIMASSGDYILGKPKITDGITDPGEDNARLVSPSFMIASRLAVITVDNIDASQDRPSEPSPGDYGATRPNWWSDWDWDNATPAQIAEYNAALSAYRNFDENDVYQKIYSRHCREYVEVYDPDNNPNTDNAIHYDDWRLPTAAEISIIYKYQGTADESADAIDYLLNAGAYYSASGPVDNPGKTTSGTSVRCIRDAY